MKPRLLDLFCGAGGCSVGYARAGFEVVGVDIEPQPSYPFEFHQADALEALEMSGVAQWLLEDFDAIHASPPCQGYSKAMKHLAAPQPRLIDPVRELLEATGLPWVIENVVGADMPGQSTLDDRHGVMVCGTALGMRIERHRLFESNFSLYAPGACRHDDNPLNPNNGLGRNRIYEEFGRPATPDWPEVVWRREMGVEWMGRYEAREAIPPAYTEFIGHQLVQHLAAARTEEQLT